MAIFICKEVEDVADGSPEFVTRFSLQSFQSVPRALGKPSQQGLGRDCAAVFGGVTIMASRSSRFCKSQSPSKHLVDERCVKGDIPDRRSHALKEAHEIAEYHNPDRQSAARALNGPSPFFTPFAFWRTETIILSMNAWGILAIHCPCIRP